MLPGQSQSPLRGWIPNLASTGEAESSQCLHSPTPRLSKVRPRAVGCRLEHSLQRTEELPGSKRQRSPSHSEPTLRSSARRGRGPQTAHLADAHTEGLLNVSSVIANGPRRKKNPVLHFITTELLTSHKKHPQALTKCPLDSCLRKPFQFHIL